MKFSKIFQTIIPKENKFFPLFESASDNLLHTAELLRKLIHTIDIEKRITYINQIKECEHIGDDLIKTILNELNKTFIVPFEREDMFSLINSLDDVIDIIDGVSQRISYLKPKSYAPELEYMADALVMACNEIKTAVYSLKDMNHPERTIENCSHVNLIEKDSDEVFRKGISNLLKDEKDMVELIKKKEIFEVMEDTIDLAEDVTDIIRSIIVRNA